MSETILGNDFNPSFLYVWKGYREQDEKWYHKHDHLEIAFMLSGHGSYVLNDETVELGEGDVLILNPGTMHRSVVIDSDNPMTEFIVGASDFRLDGLEKNALPLPETGIVMHTGRELQEKLSKICAAIEAEYETCRPDRYIMLKSYLLQMILLIVRQNAEDPREELKQSKMGNIGYAFESINKKYVVEQILHYFENHYAEKISLDRIADNMYLSPYYISRIFKIETGDAPIRHLIDIRLNKAEELLKQGKYSIREVALMVGYEDVYHFSKLYKKKFGYPPSKAMVSGK